jgi:hypothetical protein
MNAKQVTVIATRDFQVGPRNMGRFAVLCGETRRVTLNKENKFVTTTTTGSFFGVCTVDDGWKIKD